MYRNPYSGYGDYILPLSGDESVVSIFKAELGTLFEERCDIKQNPYHTHLL